MTGVQAGNGADGSPLRALVLEDEPEDAEICLHTLQAAGLAVKADIVSNVKEAGQRLRKQSYDIILSDYRLPQGTGMDAFAITRELHLQIPFVLVTGALGEEKAVECVKQGVADYVLKDHLARLPMAVERALEEQRLRDEHAAVGEALRQSEQLLRERNQELERQYQRAEAASRLKSDFLANMSHELRSPLNGIIGFSQLMIDAKLGALTECQRECVAGILSSASHLLRLINDVLDVAKIEAGKLTFRPEPVSIAHLVGEACESLAALAAEKRIRVEYHVDPQINAVVDPARFKQILYNYISNALKFTPEDGCVTVIVKSEGTGEFRIEVTDNGLGISNSDLGYLFTDFHQVDSGKGKRFQGTGLGLALTRRLVEGQRGRVGVRSELGKGSTFFAVLPLMPAKAMDYEA